MKQGTLQANEESRLALGRLFAVCLWLVIAFEILPLYLTKGLVHPVDYTEGGLGAVDFTVYYVAAKMSFTGQDIYSVDLQDREYKLLGLDQAGIYTYPSLLATALMPLASQPLEQAAQIWNLINLLLLCASVGLLSRTLDLPRRLGVMFPGLVILMAVAQPTIWAYRAGQSSILILFLLTLAFWALARDGRLAASVIGIAGVVKVFPIALVLLFLSARRLHLVAWAFGSSILVILTNALVLTATGRDATADLRYFTTVLPSLTSPNAYPFNESLNGIVSALGLPFPWGLVVTVGLTLFVVGITCMPSRSDKTQHSSLSFASCLLAVLLVSSITEVSTLVLTVIPFGVLLVVWADSGKPISLMLPLAASYVMINSIAILSISPALGRIPLGTFLPFGGVMLLWALTIWHRHTPALASISPPAE